MIGYVTVGTNDMQRAGAFYDALLAELGAKRVMETASFIMWGNAAHGVGLAVIKPHDKGSATIGNGVMVALSADSKDTVERVYNKAMALGAKDEGPAGPRGETFYAGYFRDPDGNKLNIYYMGE